MIDPKDQELIHAGIDGELDEAGLETLKTLLAGSDEARQYHSELGRLSEFLDRIPAVEPPESLHQRILDDLPAGSTTASPPQRARAGFAQWMRYGFAVAAGLVLTVAIYEGRGELGGPVDVTQMAGTLVRQGPADGELLGQAQWTGSGLDANATLSRDGDSWVLKLDSETDTPWNFEIDLADSGLAVDALVSPPNTLVYRSSGQDTSLEGSLEGTQQVIVLLRNTRGQSASVKANIGFRFYSEGRSEQAGSLTVGG